MGALSIHMPVYQGMKCPERSEEGVGSSRTGVTGSFRYHMDAEPKPRSSALNHREISSVPLGYFLTED